PLLDAELELGAAHVGAARVGGDAVVARVELEHGLALLEATAGGELGRVPDDAPRDLGLDDDLPRRDGASVRVDRDLVAPPRDLHDLDERTHGAAFAHGGLVARGDEEREDHEGTAEDRERRDGDDDAMTSIPPLGHSQFSGSSTPPSARKSWIRSCTRF